MKVVILAGGYGTRLSEETEYLPKPMIDIGGRPLLWHLMKMFSTQGFKDFIVALGYKGDVIKRYFLQYAKLESNLRIDLASGSLTASGAIRENWEVELIDTGCDTMTGGRLRRLHEKVDDTIILTYGDGLSDINLKRLVEFHRSHGKLATVTAVHPPSRFGILELDGTRVTQFNEKPRESAVLVNGGFFVLEPGTLDYIDGDKTSWEREPCEKLAENGQIHAYHHEGFWQCVDTLHELRLLRDAWSTGNAPWKVWD